MKKASPVDTIIPPNVKLANQEFKPPKATRIASLCSAHGETWLDHYAWLKPPNWQDAINDPVRLPSAITNYISAENDYHDTVTSHLEPLRAELIAEIRARKPELDGCMPIVDGGYKYSRRAKPDAEYLIYVRTDLNDENEEIIFDPNVEAKKYDSFSIGQVCHCPDHTKIMWSCDTIGSERYTLRIRQISTGLDNDFAIENVFSAVWADEYTVFYVERDQTLRRQRVFKHVLNTGTEAVSLVFEEKDDEFGCLIFKSDCQNYIYISTSTHETDEWWYIPVSDVDAPPTLIQERIAKLGYQVVGRQDDQFIISTNADGATDWKIVEVPINNPSVEHWRDVVAHSAGQFIVEVVVLKDWIIWIEQINSLPQIVFMNKDRGIRRLKFDEEAYSLQLLKLERYQSNKINFLYCSPRTPNEIHELNLSTGKCKLVKKQQISSGYSVEDYIVRRVFITSRDGAQVPVTLLYRHDTPLDGTAPALLTGYGSNGFSYPANFMATRFSLIDRGFIYAIAHVRGGGEKGSVWEEGAKRERKVNSFYDFVAVGEALIEKKICASDKLVSYGASSGGLLVSASMSMKPGLFAGVIAKVPAVDVLNSMLDGTTLGGSYFWPIWGNPADSKSVFDVMKSYSPYENTKAVAYPPIYATAGISDVRVPFWEQAKWVAKLRSLKTDNNIVLLKTDMDSGHYGGSGSSAELTDIASCYAFAISVTTLHSYMHSHSFNSNRSCWVAPW